MSASIFFSLAFAHFLAVISPGPDFFYVVKTSLQKRLSYALIASFAIGFGVFLHSMFSVYAFKILYQIIPNLYVFIGSLGGMYLLYLGISGLRNNEIEELANSTQRKEEENLFKGFREGLLVNALNVKAFIFFISLFGGIAEKTSLEFQIFISLYFFIATSIWFMFLSYFLNLGSRSILTKSVQKKIVIISSIGLIFVGIGLIIYVWT